MQQRLRALRPIMLVVAATVVAIAVACMPKKPVPRVIQGVSSGAYSELSASALAAQVICHDTLGRPEGPERRFQVSRCTPCLPYGAESSEARALAHARQLWRQTARAPYDTTDLAAGCARLAYQFARGFSPGDDSLAVEFVLFQLHDVRDSVRRVALVSFDSLLVERERVNGRAHAAGMLMHFAMGMWDRAQRLLERPAEIDVHAHEQRVRVYRGGAPTLSMIPAPPPATKDLGASEAVWSAQLFTMAAAMLIDDSRARVADRSHALRLALAPWVVMERWGELDSAARQLLRMAPFDSAVMPARALAAHRLVKHPVRTQATVMALFDSALVSVPRVDSARYDSFDDVLTVRDDKWRYGFLPDDRERLDTRGWAVLDPLWSTPVNEIRLERRARIAEADYRYADIAAPGQSGSETRSGIMLLRRGMPDAQWEAKPPQFGGRRLIQRGWRTWQGVIDLENTSDTWRVFYGQNFTMDRVSRLPFPDARPCRFPTDLEPTLYSCALTEGADWRGVPFYGATDEIDVALARFRAGGDSADVYVGARIPLRQFRTPSDMDSRNSDRIRLGLFLAKVDGTSLVQMSDVRALPRPSEISWTTQWKTRARTQAMMHRVEAVELSKPSGARGEVALTGDSMVTFSLRGFGMSDLLIADTVRTPARLGRNPSASRVGALRWRDMDITPNAAVVRPGQRFSMLWELYDLTPAPNGRIRWRVRIRRERGVSRRAPEMQAVLTGERKSVSSVIAAESDAPDISYTQDAAASSVILEQLRFGLGDAPEGRHVVFVTIDDLVSGKSTTRSVSIRVLDPRTQRRGVAPTD